MDVCELRVIKLITTQRVVPEFSPHKDRQLKRWAGWIYSTPAPSLYVNHYSAEISTDDVIEYQTQGFMIKVKCWSWLLKRHTGATFCRFLSFPFYLPFHLFHPFWLPPIVSQSCNVSFCLFYEFLDLVNLDMCRESLLARLYWLNHLPVCARHI